MSSEASAEYEGPEIEIVVYGGKEAEVSKSLESHVGTGEDAHIYQTWINVAALKRLGFVFEGGVESAGGLFDLLFLFVVIAVIFILFLVWQLVVYAAVLVVLYIFSGGAALKYLRGSFITAPSGKIPADKLESFTTEQVKKGYFVKAKDDAGDASFGPVLNKSTTITVLFQAGININLLIATAFLAFQLIFRYLTNTWALDLYILTFFGIMFLTGIVAMDAAVLWRRRFAGKLQ
jgi:hypothetical protein